MKRNAFIGIMAAGGALTLSSNNLLASELLKYRKLGKIGFISGIISEELKEDWKSVLKRTVSFGFNEIETGSWYGDSAIDFMKYCNEIGLKPIAGGLKMSEKRDEVMPLLEKLIKLELQYAVIYWPWFTGAPFSADEMKRSAGVLNQLGEWSRESGLKLCWHNHQHEFVDTGEGKPFEYFMEHTDPGLVSCEMDIYWVKYGGADPLEVLKAYKGRIPILHVKDMAAGDAMDFECAGNGIIDFRPIFREAAEQGIKHYFVERDKVEDGMACLESAGKYLKGVRF